MANKKFLVIGILAIVFLYAGYRYKFSSNTASKSVIDLSGMEPQVAEKIRSLQQQVADNPDNAQTCGKLAMTLDVHGLNSESIPYYQKATELDPKDFRWVYLCAIALKESASPEAMEWFQKSLQLRPDYVPLQIRYAKALFESNRLKESQAQFQHVVQLDPNSAEAFVGLAQIALSQNQIESAKEFGEKAVHLNPKQAEAYSLLAIIYRRLQDPIAAEKSLAQLKSLPEKTALIDPVYSALVSEGESAFWHRTRGRTYMDSGLYMMAVREFKSALQIHDDAEANDDLGAALQGLGKYDEAILYHKKAVAMNPGYLKYYNLGIAYAKLGRTNYAIEAFKNCVRLKPDFAEGFFNLGVAYFQLSQWKDAIENLKSAIQINPDHAKAHYALALSYRATGDSQSARHEQDVLTALDPKLAANLKTQEN
jgi:tetratricopeptide (TPR) repeat protein